MKSAYVVVAAALAILPTTVCAQSWYVTAMNGNETVTYANRDSIRWREGRPSIDYISVNTRPRNIDGDWFQGFGGRIEFECDTTRHRITYLAGYDIEGREVFGSEGDGEWKALEPDSGAWFTQRLVCQNQTEGIEGIQTDLETLIEATINKLTEAE